MGWQDDIGPKTQEFLKEFGIAFLKSYGVSLFLKIKAEVDAEHEEAGDDRKLQYRDWDSVPREELLSGQCWIRVGEGAGSFGGWSGAYVVEQQDCSLAIFKDAKAAAGGDVKKAKVVLLPAGYSVEKNVESFYSQQARELAAELECDQPEVAFSSFAWAMVHPLRDNYVIQLHKGAGGGCLCLGGGAKVEPDAGVENAAKAEEWASAMDEMISSSSPRDLETDAVAMAFERTVQKMSLNIKELDGFSDDGTEAQILGHMIFVAVFEAACKEEVQETVKKSPMGRVSLWYKSRGTAATIIQKAVDPAWSAMQKQATELGAKIEPQIRSGLEPILKKKLELQDKLKSQFGDKIGEAMAAKVTPLLKPLIDVFDKPLRQGVSDVVKIYESNMDRHLPDEDFSGELPASTCHSLDAVARTASLVQPLEEAAASLVQPLEAAKAAAPGAALQQLDANAARKRCLDALLQLLDAAVYTTQQEMRKEGARLPDVRRRVAADCGSDGGRAACACVRDIVVSSLLAVLHQLTADVVTPALDSLKELIPEDLQEIIDVEAEYNMLLESTIGETAGKIIEAKFKF